MGKRFTDTDKYRDKWYRSLPIEFKCAWDYVCLNCDVAGVLSVDEELFNFQIGAEIDWDAFREACGDRIHVLSDDKWFLVKFITFQYGTLSDTCRAHNPVFASIEKHDLQRLLDTLCNGYSKTTGRGQDKDKEQEQVTKKQDEWIVPAHVDSDRVRSLLAEFETMRREIKKPIKSRKNTSRILKSFEDAAHLEYAIDYCIANQYQGLKPDYRPPTSGGRSSSPPKQDRLRGIL